jgi:hypothetical protein
MMGTGDWTQGFSLDKQALHQPFHLHFVFEIGSQTSDPPASASQIAGIIGVYHLVQLW